MIKILVTVGALGTATVATILAVKNGKKIEQLENNIYLREKEIDEVYHEIYSKDLKFTKKYECIWDEIINIKNTKTKEEVEEHKMNELRSKIEKAVNNKEYGELYSIFESRYNPYPVQMARYEAFRKAVEEELIDESVEKAAQKYYGNLWNYVGD